MERSVHWELKDEDQLQKEATLAMTTEERRQMLAQRVRSYFEACNEANREKLYACFTDDVVHYFPPAVGGPYRGKQAIADLWIKSVRVNGSRWTIDRLVADEREVAIEWTHFKPRIGEHLRGAEWYEFDEQGLIRVIRAYYASPRDVNRKANELQDFPYAAKGFPMEPPDEAPRETE
jgi:SnoaL-like protein